MAAQQISPLAEQRYDEIVAAAASTVIGLDFDGTLSPIVADPAEAFVHPDAGEALLDLAARVRAVAILTGRPVEQVRRLGGLDALADRLVSSGGRLLVLGQYGNERWSSEDRRVLSPPPPEGLAGLRQALPSLLASAGAADAYVEEKGLAIAVHTRRLPDGEAAFGRLLPVLEEAATRHELAVEPGRLVVELRAPGVDKGGAVRALTDEVDAGGWVFVGDDLGDVEAFEAVRVLREAGTPGLLVCSGSTEQQALVELADFVVDGPDGVVAWLRRFAWDVDPG